MPIIRKSEAEWFGDLQSGHGTLALGSKAYQGPYSFKGRIAEKGPEANPEELIGAAHAGCFSMALSSQLANAGYPPEHIHTTAKVILESGASGFTISQIDLHTEAQVPKISEPEFLNIAENAKANCPVSRALAAVKINFVATLV